MTARRIFEIVDETDRMTVEPSTVDVGAVFFKVHGQDGCVVTFSMTDEERKALMGYLEELDDA